MTSASEAVEVRLLVVEDEEHLAAGLKMNFELEGYGVDVATSARSAAWIGEHPAGRGFDADRASGPGERRGGAGCRLAGRGARARAAAPRARPINLYAY